MFSLMDKVPSGIEPMLKDLEEHIINAGLADMVAAAETITTVRARTHKTPRSYVQAIYSRMHNHREAVVGSEHLCMCVSRTLRSTWSSY